MGQFKLGDRVVCRAYVKKSGSHYEVDKNESPYHEPTYCVFHECGNSEGIDIEDFHSCNRFKVVDACFDGVYVGTTSLYTRLNAEWCDDYNGRSSVRTYCDDTESFAIVYYADNRKRLVPLDRVSLQIQETEG